MKGLVIASVLGSIAVLGSAPANAVTYQVTYEGTISSGYDFTGQFGSAGDLSNRSISATYIFDTATIGAVHYSASGYTYLYGGAEIGLPNPLLAATLSVNGLAVAMPSGYYGATQAYPSAPFTISYVGTRSHVGDHSNFYVASVTNSFGGTFLYSPFSHTLVAGDFGSGLFEFADGTYGNVDVTSVTVSAVSDVPLPAALPLFLCGVGAVAWAARRRKRNAAALAA